MKLRYDLPASIAVFLVALPLCLGIALASGAPLMSGLVAGIVGGLVVGSISGTHTSVSGPAAGLVAIVLVAIERLESFEMFLVAVALAGVLQLLLSAARAGVIAYYFPSSVIRGLLAAIGLILILKQIPHAVGYDRDFEGDFSFMQPDSHNTFSELWYMFGAFSATATIISVVCLAAIVLWERTAKLKQSPIPSPLVAVVVGTLINEAVRLVAPEYALGQSHRVDLGAVATGGLSGLITFPDFSALAIPGVYLTAVTIAIVASLESLLNLEAADRLDPQKRVSPANRELFAQGVGNICAGMLGGLPVTTVIVRSSVNIYSGAKTKASAIMHGVWLLGAVLAIPGVISRFPLASLAAILIATGFKLAHPKIFREMYHKGWSQLLPFVITVVAIVLTDLLIGILIGLAVGIFFVLISMERAPFLRVQRQPVPGDVTRVKLGQHVTFLNRSRMLKMLDRFPDGSHVILDASATEYIDPDVLDMIRDFRDEKAPAKNLDVSFIGFRDHYELDNEPTYRDVLTPEWQESMTPADALQRLRDGNERFLNGEMIERDWCHQRNQTADSQHPMAALLGCIDSRVPAELVFDLGIGDIFSTRVAGNVVSDDVLGSLEYAGKVAKVNLIVVLGHTKCGAVSAACQEVELGHVTGLVDKIQPAVQQVARANPSSDRSSTEFVNAVVRQNVEHVMRELLDQSEILRELVDSGQLAVVGGLYDLHTGRVDFFGELADAVFGEPTVLVTED